MRVFYIGRIDASGLGVVSGEIAQDGKVVAHACGVSESAAKANAAFIVRACNSQAALVAALQSLVDSKQSGERISNNQWAAANAALQAS